LGFVHDIISRPEKEGKKKRNPISWDGARTQIYSRRRGRHGDTCMRTLGGWHSVCLILFKAKALCLFLRRFCRPVVLFW
jgi:hypothetical protein